MELQRLTAHLAKRLTVLHDGQPTVFRDSAVTPTPMSQSAPDFFRHPQGVCSHGQCRADAATGRKEGGIDDIEIVQIVRPIPPIEPANRVAIGFWPVKSVTVQRCTLDSVVYDPVSLIKIDVEGHELDVLKGATTVLEKDRPGLLVECEERHRPGGTTEMFRFLESRGYIGFFILDAHIYPIRDFTLALQDPAELAKGLPRREMRYVNNFIFLHESRDPQTTMWRIEEVLQRLTA